MSILDDGESHPIDMVEDLAERHDWVFDRIKDDQIAMAIEGQWRTYSITVAWNAHDETLRFICTFEFEPPSEHMPEVHDLLNRCNDMVWSGAFTFWAEQKLMVWRYGLLLAGSEGASPEQIETMVMIGVGTCERFYPAFQLVAWGNKTSAQAIHIGMNEVYGRA